MRDITINRFKGPDVEKPTVPCSVCDRELAPHNYSWDCDCGKTALCDECEVDCEQCGHIGCPSCMVYNKTLGAYFCESTGPSGIKKGVVESECMTEYLGVAETIVSKKERKENE